MPDAAALLSAALAQVGAQVETPGRPVDTILVRPGPAAASVAVRVRSTVSADPVRVTALLRETGRAGQATVLVADRIPDASREALRRAGWGWLDRRGHLRLEAPGLLIDTAVRAAPRREARLRPGIRGVGGLTWASALLLDGRPPVLREVARRSGLAPSTLAAAARALRDSGLGEPTSDLFWALAGEWRPDWVALADPDAASDRTAGIGPWERSAASGAEAARAWGAPAGAEAGPDRVYLADEKALAGAVERYGELRGGRAARLLVATPPTPLVLGAPVVAPLFAALDLATDPAGADTLAGWEPPEPAQAWWLGPLERP